MAGDFDYGAPWSIARDALDAVSGLTRAIIGDGRAPLVHPSAVHNPSKAYCEKYWAEQKTLPERRAKAVDAMGSNDPYKAREKPGIPGISRVSAGAKADGEGFEPPVDSRPHRFSRPTP
jgi:hypothetical protein